MTFQATLAALALSTVLASAQDAFSNLDAAHVNLSYSSGMDFGKGPGDLHATTLDATSYLGQPLNLGGGWQLASLVRYRATYLDGGEMAAGYPFEDQILQTLSIRETFIHSSTTSPWLYGAFVQGAISSDFQDVSGDAFLFDIGVGAGYKFSDRLTVLGLVAVTELNGDAWVVPLPGFDWKASDCVRVGIYGTDFVAAYHPDDNWIFSLKAAPGGGVWNIDGQAGRSERLEFRSDEVGLHVQRRLSGAWWLDLGAGVTLNNKIELGSTSGLTRFKDHLNDGWFLTAGVRLAAW